MVILIVHTFSHFTAYKYNICFLVIVFVNCLHRQFSIGDMSGFIHKMAAYMLYNQFLFIMNKYCIITIAREGELLNLRSPSINKLIPLKIPPAIQAEMCWCTIIVVGNAW